MSEDVDLNSLSEIQNFIKLRSLGNLFSAPLSILFALLIKVKVIQDLPLIVFLSLVYIFYKILTSLFLIYASRSINRELFDKQVENENRRVSGRKF